MATVYSKSNHAETDELSESNKSEIVDTNLDLYDKIKKGIARLKATKQQKDFQNSSVRRVTAM